MRKSKEQAQLDKEQREQMREHWQELERKERQEMQDEQKYARYLQRINQRKRRQQNATTKAGGKRDGAGRPSKDGQERKTYTFYGTYHEREQVKQFLRVLREIEQDRQLAVKLLARLSGETVFELFTSDSIALPDERRLIESIMPNLLPKGEKEDNPS